MKELAGMLIGTVGGGTSSAKTGHVLLHPSPHTSPESEERIETMTRSWEKKSQVLLRGCGVVLGVTLLAAPPARANWEVKMLQNGSTQYFLSSAAPNVAIEGLRTLPIAFPYPQPYEGWQFEQIQSMPPNFVRMSSTESHKVADILPWYPIPWWPYAWGGIVQSTAVAPIANNTPWRNQVWNRISVPGGVGGAAWFRWQLRNLATGMCLADGAAPGSQGYASVIEVPCSTTDPGQLWGILDIQSNTWD